MKSREGCLQSYKYSSTCVHFLEGVLASQLKFHLYLLCEFCGGCGGFQSTVLPVSALLCAFFWRVWRVWWLPKYSSTCICSAMCIFFEGVAASPVQFYLYLLCAYSGGRDSFTITVLPVSAVCILWRVWWLPKYSSTCICSAVCIFFGGCGASQVQFYHLLCAFSGGCSSFTS